MATRTLRALITAILRLGILLALVHLILWVVTTFIMAHLPHSHILITLLGLIGKSEAMGLELSMRMGIISRLWEVSLIKGLLTHSSSRTSRLSSSNKALIMGLWALSVFENNMIIRPTLC